MDDSHTLVLDMQKRFLSDWNQRISANNENPDNDFAPMWGAAAELGLTMAIAPDKHGGLGDDGDFHFSYFHQRGALLACANFGAALAGAWAILSATNQNDSADTLGSGAMRPALPTFPEEIGTFPKKRTLTGQETETGIRLWGQFDIVRAAPLATHIFAPVRMEDNGDSCIVLLDTDDAAISIVPFTLVDKATAGKITITDLMLKPTHILARGPLAEAIWVAAQTAMIAATAAEATGVMQSLLDQTVAYVRQRQQFGASIGSFQSVQHRLAEMLVEIELTHSLALAASRDLSDTLLASAAKARANDALQKMADCAVQFHGGIGTTEELALSRYFRRAMALRGELGTTEQHFRLIENAICSEVQPASPVTRSAA
ncbi:acyl-CoA dehydrogenase family protein [Aquisediminimonas sediminicola]|uniref:acyl-CoA dehydrogenase family protein n=1 Tax=Alteraquisediminimonas sediminicola TaxID=2676787 RepID=UPI001C8D91C9|nr:acyl-CoA dehydrogenase family protein [Aquisediminimonas sediminicola]